MKPVFLESDHGIIIADLLSPKVRGFRKNDIVLFNNPYDKDSYICKRIILTEGEIKKS